MFVIGRKVWIYQRGSQKSYNDGYTIQCPTDKGQTMIYKASDRKLKIEQHQTAHPPKKKQQQKTSGGDLGCPGRVNSSCYNSGSSI